MRLRLAIVVLAAALPAVATGAAQKTVLGTERADFLAGTEKSDRILARGGNDRVAAEYDGGLDRVTCGAGRDVVVADARDRIDPDCEVVSRRIHRDRHANIESQHESEVEPDSQTVGQTTVAVFQVGRRGDGGAASIGFSTSKDGGRSWREGLLPGLTVNTAPRGPSAKASDPVVAYDAAHGVWLANSLAIAGDATRLTIHRSPDGVSWTGPIDAAVLRAQHLAYDKNWLTCDNGPTSPFRGRCYLAYTLIGEREDDLAVQRSDDGGRTWSQPVTSHLPVTGVIPVVRPDGMLVLVFWSGRSGMVAVSSTDGGVTLGPAVVISDLKTHDTKPLRAPSLVAADVEPSGRIVAVWQDCRFRAACTANDVVLSRSTDGTTWSPPARVTTGRSIAVPTIGVEPGTGRLAIAYYAIQPNGIDAELITSADGVRWTVPQRLNARRMPLAWLPDTTLGKMLADYIGVSWSRGRPLVVYALASPPKQDEFRQAIYAARG
ncbi:MAG TPA: sialidase family protein [Gaiellaceae bacterium]|nr:sialidase family protein [Gaiellaceae bacterium]